MRNILSLTICRMHVRKCCFTRINRDFSGLAKIKYGNKASEQGGFCLNWLTLRKTLQQLPNVPQIRVELVTWAVCKRSFFLLSVTFNGTGQQCQGITQSVSIASEKLLYLYPPRHVLQAASLNNINAFHLDVFTQRNLQHSSPSTPNHFSHLRHVGTLSPPS